MALPSDPAHRGRPPDLWRISFSAFFADLGYQAVLALFPLYLVLHLGAPVWVFGLSQALAYGPGALFGYWGGRLGDRYGRRKVALFGNAFLPLLALIGLAGVPWLAVLLLAVGWWARNLRSPPRRALVTEAVPAADHGSAFGLLHALDVGGGMLAAVYAFLLLEGGVPYGDILLGTALPLVVSTAVLWGVRAGRSPPTIPPPAPRPAPSASPASAGAARWLVSAILSATLLYGFASYSIGFPVLSTAQATGVPAFGVLVFIAFLGVSALVGLAVGGIRVGRVRLLALGGYGLAAAGSALLAIGSAGLGGLPVFLGGAGTLGAALGVVETFEPTLIARAVPEHRHAREFGRLTAFRSAGLFVANLVLGLLFVVNPAYPYLYALLAAGAAAILIVAMLPRIGAAGDAAPSGSA
ncbi:MAG: MFS transporter [Thermoplasmata archaeon]